MSFIGAMGVVAQQGNQGGVAAPTGVSIASSSSGNYDNAIFSLPDNANCGAEGHVVEASDFSSNAVSYNVVIGELASTMDGCDVVATQSYNGYIRATNATSFQWGLVVYNQSLSNSCVASTNGVASTDQDETSGSSGDIGEHYRLTPGGGRGGVTWPSAGDSVVLKVTGSATNSGGTTSATTLTITYNYVS